MDFGNDKNKHEVELVKGSQTNIRRSCLSWTSCWPVFRNATIDESLEMENPKNPMLLSPVIRCVLKFLNIEDIKNCRLLSREWGSTGKLVLASRAKIYFNNPGRPADFRSCFLESSSLFSAFVIFGLTTKIYWTFEELTNFFGEHQKSIKELTLHLGYPGANIIAKTFDISCWISKSPMVQQDAKYLTKLSIKGDGENLNIPLHVIAHIKDLTLSNCRINIEKGIWIYPVKLNLGSIAFFKDGIQLSRIRINDFVDFRKAKIVSLNCPRYENEDFAKYVVDLLGNTSLERLVLKYCEIVNGERSQWAIEQLSTVEIPYSLNNQMKIKELYLSCPYLIDLYTLPNTIQKLAVKGIDTYSLRFCTKPIFLENLHHLYILESPGRDVDFSFLSHFKNCPQLTHLELHLQNQKKMNYRWMPKSVKVLTLGKAIINWNDGKCFKLEKLVLLVLLTIDEVKALFKAKIQVDDLVVLQGLKVNKYLADFLKYQKQFKFGKRLYIGCLNWEEKKLKDSDFKKHFDAQSSCYVFQENKEKGRALSTKDFAELANIPKHLNFLECTTFF